MVKKKEQGNFRNVVNFRLLPHIRSPSPSQAKKPPPPTEPSSRIRNRHARTRPLALIQVADELGDIGPVRLIKRHQGIAAGLVRDGGDGEVGAGEALGAVDDELVFGARGDGGVLGGEADVEAADAEVGVLDVEVVGVAHGAVLEDGDADVAYGKEFIVSLLFSLSLSL